MNIYLTLERRVMDAILDQLAVNGIKPVLMHDGFMGRVKVDTDALTLAVREKTAFEIRLSAVQLGEAVEIDDEPDVDELMRSKSSEDFKIETDGAAL